MLTYVHVLLMTSRIWAPYRESDKQTAQRANFKRAVAKALQAQKAQDKKGKSNLVWLFRRLVGENFHRKTFQRYLSTASALLRAKICPECRQQR